jgi:hypothetical protein
MLACGSSNDDSTPGLHGSGGAGGGGSKTGGTPGSGSSTGLGGKTTDGSGTGGKVATGGSGGISCGGSTTSGGTIGTGGTGSGGTGSGGVISTGGKTGLGGASGAGGTSIDGPSAIIDGAAVDLVAFDTSAIDGGKDQNQDAPVTCATWSDSLACATDADCCLVYDECWMHLNLVAKRDVESVNACFATKDKTYCPSCCPPIVDTWCEKGQCVGTIVSTGCGTSHCGRLRQDAAVSLSAHKSPSDASVPTGTTTFGDCHKM